MPWRLFTALLADGLILSNEKAKMKKADEYLRNKEKQKLSYGGVEPHRDPKTGKIIIENSQLYNEDVKNYGAYQAQQWVQQGKYNLTPEELEKERERIRAKYDYLCKLANE